MINRELLSKEWSSNDNYKIVETGSRTGRALIFPSSNALYFPDTEAELSRTVESGYFEYVKTTDSKRIKEYYEKIIFIRDIFKKWYVTGINGEINSIDKILEFLIAETAGYKVSVCGNSAGGYIAYIIGISLNAERIINVSGQFTVVPQIKPGNLLDEYKEDYNYSKYYDLSKLSGDLGGGYLPLFCRHESIY